MDCTENTKHLDARGQPDTKAHLAQPAHSDAGEHSTPGQEERLRAWLAAMQERLAEIGMQIRRLEAAQPGGGDAITIYGLLLRYADAQREANAALAAWRAWLRAMLARQTPLASLFDAASATTAATIATAHATAMLHNLSSATPPAPSPHLRFIRWLYEQGRLSG